MGADLTAAAVRVVSVRVPATAMAVSDKLSASVDGHADQYRPLAGYGALIAVFNAGMAAFLVSADRRGALPERYTASDLALMAVGTFKLSRLIAKDRVTSGIRAPFTRFQGDAGHGEVDEAARGRGLRRAIGELLVCDYCLAQWTAAGFVAGHAVAPRPTRAVAAMFTIYAASDVLQLGYTRLEEQA
jgi:hypothetical protein